MWADTDEQVVAGFDSVTTLLQYTSTATAFRFLHTLTTRFRSVGARACYRLDPGAHDDQAVAKFVHLFDAVVEVNDDGGRTVTV